MLVGVALLAPVAASAQNASYTLAQSEAGARAYQTAACVACHGADLAGLADAPALTGSQFANSWGGGAVSSLLSFVKENMPATAPGSLSDETYVSLVAYLLAVNGVAPGETPLAMGSSATIVVGAAGKD
jgi:cytochrome c